MTDDEIDGIIAWVIERGLVGASEIELLHGFCERSVAAGLALNFVYGFTRIAGRLSSPTASGRNRPL